MFRVFKLPKWQFENASLFSQAFPLGLAALNQCIRE